MKHAFAWLMALALAFPTISTAQDTVMTQDQQDVLNAIQTMTTNFQNNDITAVMTSYEDVATVLFEPASPVSETAQMKQMFAGMAAVNPVFTYSGHEVIVNGDIAMHIAPWTMTGQTPDGNEIGQSGLSIAVLRRQADGSWKMVIDNPHGSHLMTSNQ